MMRLVPYPILSAFLLGMWLILNQSVSPGQMLLGSIIGIAGGLAISTLQIPTGRIRRPGTILRLAVIVLLDIVRSNIAVTRIILNPDLRARSDFIWVTLDIRNEYALTLLACIVTSTPGTVWVNFDRRTGALLLHVLDVVDEQTWIDLIKTRYERLLLEIFE